MSSSSSSTSQPTTRSRTLLFISYRDSRARSSRFSRTRPPSSYDDTDIGSNEYEGLMNSQPGHVSLDVDLPPIWCHFHSMIAYVKISPHLYTLFRFLQGRCVRSGTGHPWRNTCQKCVGVSAPMFTSAHCFLCHLFVCFPTVTALEKLHAKHALPGFTDRSAEEKEIEAATTGITKVCDFIHFISRSSPHPIAVPRCLFRNRIFGNVRN
jgi:syntaxin 16